MKPCDYFDYEPLSEEDWHKKLENSETFKYVFINYAIALSKVGEKYFIKHYKDHNVNTWSFDTNEEASKHMNQIGNINWATYAK